MTESEGDVLASFSPIALKASREICASAFARFHVFSRPWALIMSRAIDWPRRRLTGGVNG